MLVADIGPWRGCHGGVETLSAGIPGEHARLVAAGRCHRARRPAAATGPYGLGRAGPTPHRTVTHQD
ncbi:hypothetical protein [Streptomyces sp. NPDC054804]